MRQFEMSPWPLRWNVRIGYPATPSSKVPSSAWWNIVLSQTKLQEKDRSMNNLIITRGFQQKCHRFYGTLLIYWQTILWKTEEKECFPNGVWTTYGVEVAESYQKITHRLKEDHHPEKGEKVCLGGVLQKIQWNDGNCTSQGAQKERYQQNKHLEA